MVNSNTSTTATFGWEYPEQGYDSNSPTWAELYGQIFEDIDSDLAVNDPNIKSVTSDVTASEPDIILADASGGSLTVTLPAPSTDVHVSIKKTSGAGNTVTVATPGSETIDGDSSRTISNQYTARTIVSDGADYYII